MVSFETLVPEILSEILCHLPDLECLDAVLRASPSAWREFDAYGVHIMNRVLDSGYIHPHSCTAMRTIAAVRLDCLPVATVAELQRRVTCEAILDGAIRMDDDGNDVEIEDAIAPTDFPATATPEVMRKLLITARRVAFWTLGWLDGCLQRFSDATPLTVRNQHYILHYPKYDVHKSIRDLRADNPKIVPYAPRDLSRPVWSEEQVMYRAFWRMQLVRDIKAATAEKALSGWTDDEIAKFAALHAAEIYDFKKATDIIAFRSDYNGYCPADEEMTEHSAVLLAEAHLQATPAAPPRSWSRPWPAPPLRPTRFLPLETKCVYIGRWSAGVLDYNRVYHTGNRNSIIRPSFAPYRELGFHLWTRERLQANGFGTNYLGGDWTRLRPFTWASVLPEEEIAEVTRKEEEQILDSNHLFCGIFVGPPYI